MFDLPVKGMVTTSCAWSSSSDCRTTLWRSSTSNGARPEADDLPAAVLTGCSVKGSPGEQGHADIPCPRGGRRQSTIPAGVLRANGGCGRVVGRQAKED